MTQPRDIARYNQAAWDRQVAEGNQWTVPVSPDQIAAARRGSWQIVLTPSRPVPVDWFGKLQDSQVLCLAGGGGQQGPILAAAGANVTVYDNSPAQLKQDESVAARDDLNLTTVQGDMRQLTALATDSFDLVVHPCSNGFVPDVRPVWEEAFRVLKPGGRLMSGFINPVFFLFDDDALQRGEMEVRFSIPYSDERDLSESELKKLVDTGEPLSFGHTLSDQIGGQLDAGFRVIDFLEDRWSDSHASELDRYISCFIATLAEKPAG